MRTVNEDIKLGERIERLWGRYLESHQDILEIHYSKGKVPGWDVMAKNNQGEVRFYECKWDASAQSPWRRSKTGKMAEPTHNMFVEFMNPRTGRDSGLFVTSSDWWVYIMKTSYSYTEMTDVGKYGAECLVMKPEDLKQLIAENTFRQVDTLRDTVGGKVNARGYLIPLSTIKNSGMTYLSIDFTEYIRLLFL